MEVKTDEIHLGDLPSEVINYILKWVVSKELDLRFGNNCKPQVFPATVTLSKMCCFDFFLSNIQVPGKSSSRLQGVVPRSQRSGYLETRLYQGIQLHLQMQNHNLSNLYKVWGKNNTYPKPLCWRQAFLTR